jgi:hypothetical protein
VVREIFDHSHGIDLKIENETHKLRKCAKEEVAKKHTFQCVKKPSRNDKTEQWWNLLQ